MAFGGVSIGASVAFGSASVKFNISGFNFEIGMSFSFLSKPKVGIGIGKQEGKMEKGSFKIESGGIISGGFYFNIGYDII